MGNTDRSGWLFEAFRLCPSPIKRPMGIEKADGRRKYKGRRELKNFISLINFDREETLVALIRQVCPYKSCSLEHLRVAGGCLIGQSATKAPVNGSRNYKGPILRLSVLCQLYARLSFGFKISKLDLKPGDGSLFRRKVV